jgi:cation:H+ antiporter
MGTTGLLVAFVAFCVVTWIAGIWLTRTTDAIDARYKLGSAFGGLLILGITTSLPEIAVVVSAAIQKHYGMIIGTLIGGVAIQTAVIAIFDVAMRARKRSLTFSAASLTLVLEAAFVILVVTAAILAIHTPLVMPHTRVSLVSIFIVGLWIGGLWMVHRARNGKGLPWKAEAMAALPGRTHQERRKEPNHKLLKKVSMTTTWTVFAASVTVTLIAGIGVQATGNTLASHFHISSGLFAATVIAFAGALPNISTGIASIRLGDYQLAMSDIFGGNAFMPALFMVCDLITGNAVLRNASSSDIWFASLGLLLTTIYLIGLIVRSRRMVLGMGIDSLMVAVLYIAGIVSLIVSGGTG